MTGSGTTGKVDFKKTLDTYRASRTEFRVLDVPAVRYLMIDGHGDPNSSPEFGAAVESLYPVAYTMKFASKRELGRDYVVPPLEGLWWAEDMDSFTTARDKSRWDWTLMIMVPNWIGREEFTTAVARTRRKNRPTRIDDVRFGTLTEGRCVQILHVGSFDDETTVLEKLHHDFLPRNGFHMTGRHHEIYLGDFRRVAPEKQRTILRQPISCNSGT